MKQSFRRAVTRRYWFIVLMSLFLVIGALAYAHITIQAKQDAIVATIDELPDDYTIVVPGSAVDYTAGLPRPVVQSRLDTARELYITSDATAAIIVSGHVDNEARDYNEPEVMRRYLVNSGVSPEDIIQDDSGDSSYLTCDFLAERSSNDSYVITTQITHLPRMLYLCKGMGLDASGFVAPSVDSRRWFAFQTIREAFSNVKAIYDTQTR